jgi:hypothetical protein
MACLKSRLDWKKDESTGTEGRAGERGNFLKMEAENSSEKAVNICQNIQRHITASDFTFPIHIHIPYYRYKSCIEEFHLPRYSVMWSGEI